MREKVNLRKEERGGKKEDRQTERERGREDEREKEK